MKSPRTSRNCEVGPEPSGPNQLPLHTKSDMAASPFTWWGARRLRYNVGLAVAGVLAFIAYSVVGSTMLPIEDDFEVTIFALFFQGFGYLLMMAVANAFYSLGPLSECIVRPRDPARYRRICFGLGFWFSVLLPFSIPTLLALQAVFHWTYRLSVGLRAIAAGTSEEAHLEAI